MSLLDFRSALLDQLLVFLWRQWSALGVLGTSGDEEEWILDPEPLLVFSLEIARYEPRLFDEILSWLLTNGQRLDAARLKKILINGRSPETSRVVGACLRFVSESSQSRKWDGVVKFGHGEHMAHSIGSGPEALFRLKSGEPHPFAREHDAEPTFLEFGLNRPSPKTLVRGTGVPVNAHANIRFLLRSLFGGGARAESILYLLTHEAGHPADIADATGFFWLSVREALEDLADSKIVQTRNRGKRVEYWVSHKRWWDFIGYTGNSEMPKPKWVHWVDVYAAFSQLWRTVDELAQGGDSEYMTASKLQDSLEVLHREFSSSGIDVPAVPTSGLPPDLQQKAALRLLSSIFGMEHGESSHHA